MKIQTLSIVVGGPACNAKCPFCVSRMTGKQAVTGKETALNVANFRKACRLAELGGTTTVLLTGKGEPTLYPGQVGTFLGLLSHERFPLVELQTNGIELGILAEGQRSKVPGMTVAGLERWRDLGLNTIAISACHFERKPNQAVYGDRYPELDTLIGFLKDRGFTVRLCAMMLKGGIDTPAAAAELRGFCHANGVDQLTLRPIRRPDKSVSSTVADFVNANCLTDDQELQIRNWAAKFGTPLMSLMHGATVYDIQGQNVCLTDALTKNQSSEEVRSLIFYSDGRLTYDWQYAGAVILGGRK